MAKLKSGTRIYGDASVDNKLQITSGPALVGTATSTGTASQSLQVTGGAYVSGSLGIGTTNATQSLDVNGNVRLRGGIYDVNNSSGSSNNVLSSNGSGGWSWQSLAAVGGNNITIDANDTANLSRYLVFANISSGSTATEYVSTTGLVFNPSSSSLGIGTTNPTSKLHVVGDGRFAGVITATTFSASNIVGSALSISSGISTLGVTTTTSLTAQQLNVSGLSTFSGITTHTAFLFGTQASFSGVVTATQLDLSANATANDSVLYLSGTPTSSSGINGLLGVGTIGFTDTDIIANFTHNVNSYAQLIVQNKNSGTSASSDVIVNNDRSAGTTYYGDFGINGTTFATGGPFGDPDGTYLYSAGGTLSLGSLNSYDVKIATNNTERVRINATGVGIGTTNPSQSLHVQGNARVTGAIYDSTNSPGTTSQVLQSTVTGTQWTTATAPAVSGTKFDTTIDSVLYVQPTGTLDIVGVGTTTSQITTLPSGSNRYIVHSIHVTNISNGDAEVTAGFVMNARKVPATISVSVGSSGGPGIHTFTVGSASSITVGMAVTGTGNIGETTGIGTTAGFQFNTYVTSVDGNNITLSKPMSGYATGTLFFSPVSKVSSRLPVPVGSAVELLKQPMILNALDSIVLQSTGAGTGIGTTSSNTITYTSGSAVLTVTNQAASFFNSIAIGNLVQNTGISTGIQANTYVGASYTGITTSYAGTGVISIPITRPVNATVGVATALSFTEIVVPEDGALQATITYQSTTDTSYLNGTGTVAGIASFTSTTAGLSSTPVSYYGTGNTYPSVIQSIKVSNISDSIIYPGGDYPVWVGIGNSDTVFSWLAYNMMIPRNSSIELCEGPKRLGIGQSIFAYSNTPYAIEIQIAGKQKTS